MYNLLSVHNVQCIERPQYTIYWASTKRNLLSVHNTQFTECPQSVIYLRVLFANDWAVTWENTPILQIMQFTEHAVCYLLASVLQFTECRSCTMYLAFAV